MKQSLIPLLILLAGLSLHAQEEPATPEMKAGKFCGADLLPQDPEAAKTFNQRLQEYRKNNPRVSERSAIDYTIPVVIYEINCSANNPPLFTPQQAEGQIAVLNQYFNPEGIQFCLATEQDGQPLPGNPLPGVIRINASPECTPTTQQVIDNVIGLSNLPHDRYLRIFVVRNFGVSPLLGISAFPWLPAANQGILIKSSVFGSIYNCGGCNLSPEHDLGHILVHEVGHYLGLYHTFEGGCVPAGSNCNTTGDMICDTPPDDQLYDEDDCPANPANFACPGELPPLVHNFMTYASEECLNSFTPNQIDRIKDVLDTDRAVLVSQNNLDYTGVDCTPTTYCNIYASNSFLCAGETATFDNFFYDDASYSWNFDDNNAQATGTPVSHPFNNPGHFTVKLEIVRNGVKSACEHDIYVHTCTPINSSQGLWYFGTWAGLDFSSGIPVAELSAYNNATISAAVCSIVQADGNNDLLFYSDGINVYDENHQLVNSLQPLMGVSGSAQAGVSVPVPGQPGSYYLFVPGSTGQLTYSVITDIGSSVMLSQVNTIVNPGVTDYSSSPITAIPICDGSGYWVLVTRPLGPDEVHVYRVNINGIALATIFNSTSAYIGCIKASPAGTKVVLCGNPFTVCDFDGATGTLSDEKTMANFARFASFSPNSELVYSIRATGPLASQVWQHQVNVPAPGTTGVLLESVAEGLGAMQLGPDGRIYVARNSQHQIGVINYPDLISTAGNNESGFTRWGPLLENPISTLGLPNFIDAGTSGCDPCANEITVEKECRQGNGRYYAHVTLYYQGVPISMYNDPNCCVTWEYVNGIPTLPCPRPNWAPNQNFNPMNLSQGQHYKVTIICGDCTYEETGYIDCDPNRPGMSKPGLFGAEKEAIATIYPNPAQNEIAVRLREETVATENYNLMIVDAYGREVLRHPLLGNTDWQVLDISGFTPGVYAWYLVGAHDTKVMDQGKIIVIP